MWIQIRTIDGKETRTVEDLSRLTKIESLRLKIQDIFHVSPQQQRLFYRGKQVNAVVVVVCVKLRRVVGALGSGLVPPPDSERAGPLVL